MCPNGYCGLLYGKALLFAVLRLIKFWLDKNRLYHFISAYFEGYKPGGRLKSYIFKTSYWVIPLFESLQNRKLTQNQTHNLLLVSVLSPLFDDAIELGNVANYLKVIEQNEPDSRDDKIDLFARIYRALTANVPREVFYGHLQRLVGLETMPAHKHELLEKGSIALLIYAACAEIELDALQRDFIMRMGAYFQLIDDIYDMEKDWQKGLTTLPLWVNKQQLKHILRYRMLRLLKHEALHTLRNKNKKTIEGMIFLLYCSGNTKLWKGTTLKQTC